MPIQVCLPRGQSIMHEYPVWLGSVACYRGGAKGKISCCTKRTRFHILWKAGSTSKEHLLVKVSLTVLVLTFNNQQPSATVGGVEDFLSVTTTEACRNLLKQTGSPVYSDVPVSSNHSRVVIPYFHSHYLLPQAFRLCASHEKVLSVLQFSSLVRF